MEILLLIVVVLLLLYFFRKTNKKQPPSIIVAPAGFKEILAEQVPFYKQLTAENKTAFETRALQFLAQVKITGVKTAVEDLDRALIAASAIIPIFNFPDWEYMSR